MMIFWVLVSLVILDPRKGDACESQKGLSLHKDGTGKTYAVWVDNGAIYANTINAGSSTWNNATLLSGTLTPANQSQAPMLSVSSQGKAIAAWLAPWPENQNQSAVYVSMYNEGVWETTPTPISDPTDSIINKTFDISVNDNEAGVYNVVATYYAYTSENVFEMRVTSAIFSAEGSWTTPVSMPISP